MTLKIDLSKLPQNTNECFIPYYKNQSRYLILYGGAGSGKSRFAGQKILYRLLTDNEQHRVLVCRKVATSLRDSVFKLLKDYISAWKLQSIFKINESDMFIKCARNDSEIIFKGLDDVEKIKSIERITAIWMEEASEASEQDFDQLDLRLRGDSNTYKQMILSFNPISARHWLKTRFFDRGMPDSAIVHTTYKDNRFLDEHYAHVLESLQKTNPDYYAIYCLGQWGVITRGAYYASIIESLEKQGRITKLPIDTRAPIITAWDLGYGDSTAIWFAQTIGRELRIVDYYESSGQSLSHYAQVLRDKGYNYYLHILPHDADHGSLQTGMTTVQMLKRHGLGKMKVLERTSVEDGIFSAKEFLSRCFFDKERCRRGLDCLREYQRPWDEKLQAFKPKPLHDWTSHGADAFRYLAQGYTPHIPAAERRTIIADGGIKW